MHPAGAAPSLIRPAWLLTWVSAQQTPRIGMEQGSVPRGHRRPQVKYPVPWVRDILFTSARKVRNDVAFRRSQFSGYLNTFFQR